MGNEINSAFYFIFGGIMNRNNRFFRFKEKYKIQNNYSFWLKILFLFLFVTIVWSSGNNWEILGNVHKFSKIISSGL